MQALIVLIVMFSATGALSLVTGCAKSNGASSTSAAANDAANSTSSMATAVASGAVAQSSGQNVGRNSIKTPFQKLEKFLSPVSTAWASTACATYASPQGALCAGTGAQTIALSYSGCSFGTSTATWSGGQNLTFGGSAICGTTNLPIVNSGDTLSRTFVGTIPGGTATTRTSASGVVVKLDSTTASGFSQAVSGGMLITGTGGGQTIAIQGLHLTSSIFDHTVSTAVSLNVVTPGANRTIQSGTILVQHNIAHYTGTAIFNNVVYNGASCFPQSGSVATTFSGTLTGQETLTFNGGGSATLVDVSGVSTLFTMQHCF